MDYYIYYILAGLTVIVGYLYLFLLIRKLQRKIRILEEKNRYLSIDIDYMEEILEQKEEEEEEREEELRELRNRITLLEEENKALKQEINLIWDFVSAKQKQP
jgi:SMC interacting uncharacterized protein involved in chromosome segregation